MWFLNKASCLAFDLRHESSVVFPSNKSEVSMHKMWLCLT